jgi:hypothetical protein
MAKSLLLIENNEKKGTSSLRLVRSLISNKDLLECVDHKPTERLKDGEEQVKLNGLHSYNLITGKKLNNHYTPICTATIIQENTDHYELRP